MRHLEYTLHDEIFAVFERTCREGDFDVAEYLLRALEAVARRQRGEQELDSAYLTLANPSGLGAVKGVRGEGKRPISR